MRRRDLNEPKFIWSRSWLEADDSKPKILLFRKEIYINSAISHENFQITADTRYKLYINGDLVETGPSKGDNQIWFYDTVSIMPYLKQGKNIFAVSVLRYPENEGNHSMFRTITPFLYISGFVRDINGEEYDLSSNSSWKCKKYDSVEFIQEELGFSPLYIHEKAYGNPETKGWNTAYYNDNNWEQAEIYSSDIIQENSSLNNLKPRTIPFLYRKKKNFSDIINVNKSQYSKEEWLKFIKGEISLTFPAESETIVEIDAGEEMTGYMKTQFSGGGGSEVQFLYSESYVQDELVGPSRTPLKTNRLDFVNGHLEGYKDTYIVSGFENETYEPYWFRTFRFIQIHITTHKNPLKLCEISYEETGYPIEIETKVTVSDKTLDKIWEISERTLKRCMHETYEDCPFYEQLQYVMDSRQQILYTYAVSADDRLARKCMDDMKRSQRKDGLLNACYPNRNINVIPGFSVYYILMVYDHMMYFGSPSLVREHMPAIYKILDFFDNHLSENGYVDKIGGILMQSPFWSFIDWAEEWGATTGMPPAGLKGSLTMESLLYLYGLSHAQKLAEYIGDTEKVKILENRAENLKAALKKHCIGQNGMIQDGPHIDEYSQQCQVFGILTGITNIETGRKNLLETINNKKHYAQCTVAMRFYLFRAFEITGLYEYTNEYWNVWRKMIENNCTTCIESEAYARSECHGWGALILYELPSASLGVTPAQAGYKKIKISPVTGYLSSASGTVKTPVGNVYVSWEKSGDVFKINYHAPEDIEVIIENKQD